jgi:phospholipid/cholesterol/gamma-HCH transport system substrate-binding protein
VALKSLRDVNQRVVAVISVLVIGAACAFAFVVGQLHVFDSGYSMSGVFTDTGGIKAGDDVRVAGVKVGRITGVSPDYDHGKVIVSWSVDGGIHLGRQTRAEVQLSTLLGGRYLRLTGPVAPPYIQTLPAAQRRVPLDRTGVPFTVTDALQNTTRITQSLDQKSITKLLDATAKIKVPGRDQLHTMLTNFTQLTKVLNDDNPEIQQLIANSKQVTGTLASKNDQLVRIIDASRSLLATLVARRNELAATLGQGNQVVASLTATITQHEKQIDQILANLHLLTTRLAPNMESLNTGLAVFGPTIATTASTYGQGGRWVEGLLTGLGPLQPPGPVSSRLPGG